MKNFYWCIFNFSDFYEVFKLSYHRLNYSFWHFSYYALSCKIFVCLFVCFIFLFRPSLEAFPGQRLNCNCSCHPIPQPQLCQIWAVSVTYTRGLSNTRSLTHWGGPGIEPTPRLCGYKLGSLLLSHNGNYSSSYF